jgi:D-serine deaminase-like pyridoxal phosphate-dependent protein
MTVVDQLAALPTPALLLDERRILANIARPRERAMGLGVRLRVHLKTAKSVDVARRLPEGARSVSVVIGALSPAGGSPASLLRARSSG